MKTFNFEAKFFKNGGKYTSSKYFSIFLDGVSIPFDPECLFLYLPLAFDKFAQGEEALQLSLDLGDEKEKNFLASLVQLSNNYKTRYSFSIPQKDAHSYQLIGKLFNNHYIKMVAEEVLINGTTIYQIFPLSFFPYTSNEFDQLWQFTLFVNDFQVSVCRYLLFLVSETIKEEILNDNSIEVYSINLRNHHNLQTVLQQFQNFFKGNDIEINHENIGILKELSEYLRIYTLRRACLLFEHEERQSTRFSSIFQDEEEEQ
jgi:hypothetical protein